MMNTLLTAFPSLLLFLCLTLVSCSSDENPVSNPVSDQVSDTLSDTVSQNPITFPVVMRATAMENLSKRHILVWDDSGVKEIPSEGIVLGDDSVFSTFIQLDESDLPFLFLSETEWAIEGDTSGTRFPYTKEGNQFRFLPSGSYSFDAIGDYSSFRFFYAALMTITSGDGFRSYETTRFPYDPARNILDEYKGMALGTEDTIVVQTFEIVYKAD